jgi:hypothetical protein
MERIKYTTALPLDFALAEARGRPAAGEPRGQERR